METHGLRFLLHQLGIQLPVPRDAPDKLQNNALESLGTSKAKIHSLAAAQEQAVVQ